VSPDGALNFKMLADLKGGMVGELTKVAAMGGKEGIPFSIEGTTSNPHFIPDVRGAAGGIAQGVLGQVISGKNGAKESPADAVMGLFGKKKK
jgi:hypothetical protein